MKQLVRLTICVLLILFAAELSSAQKPELVVQTGHSDAVRSVAFSPDGRIFASSGEDNAIKLWDVATRLELRTLSGHISWVDSIAFSPDGKVLASGSQDGTVKLWDVASGAILRSFKSASPRSVKFSSNGKILACGSADPEGFSRGIRMWDVPSGAPLDPFNSDVSRSYSIAISPDGKLLASAGIDSIDLWDPTNKKKITTLQASAPVAFSPDGSILASGDWGRKTIKLWNTRTWADVRQISAQLPWMMSLTFSPDGKVLVSGIQEKKTVKAWEIASGREVHSFETTSEIESVAISPDGNLLVGGGKDGTIRLWEMTDYSELGQLNGRTNGGINAVAINPDGKLLALNNYFNPYLPDKTISLWDMGSGRETSLLTGHSWVETLAFSHDGNFLVSSDGEGMIKSWNTAGGSELRTFKACSSSIAFNPNGKTLIVVCGDKFQVRDMTDYRFLNSIQAPELVNVTQIAVQPDLKKIAAGIRFMFAGDKPQPLLLDLAPNAQIHKLKGHCEYVIAVSFSPDGRLLATGSEDTTIKLWDVTSEKDLRTLAGHTGAVTTIAFKQDGKTIVSGSQDGTVRFWRVETGELLATLVRTAGGDWIVVTPDGLFDGSPAAWNKIIWRFKNNTFDHAPVEAFFNEFYYPGLLADIFAGKHPKAPSDISQKDRRQPRLKLTVANVQPDAKLTARNVSVKIDISEAATDKDHKTGSGAQDVRLFRNGSLVKVWHDDVLKGQSSVTLEASIPIVAGVNNFTAYAFNHDNIKSSDATLAVNGAESLKRQGTAYILAVGINSYTNQDYDLKYAVDDAHDFAADVKRQQDLLKRYAHVEVISLTDTEATKTNITEKLTHLAPRVQPEDAVIVYFAGHGTAHGNQFYLIPHDLGYDGPREKLDDAGLEKIIAHSTSDRELERIFERIDAGQLLLVIDACNSGQALEAEEKRRGPMNSKGLAQLAYEKGMYILAAAQSYQAAKEVSRSQTGKEVKHGLLTFALLEGLSKAKPDSEGNIREREWLNYATEEVPKMQEQNSLDALRGRGRYVIFVGDGRDLGIPKNDVGARDNIHRPRIFYRRELESNPLVVAVLKATAPQ